MDEGRKRSPKTLVNESRDHPAFKFFSFKCRPIVEDLGDVRPEEESFLPQALRHLKDSSPVDASRLTVGLVKLFDAARTHVAHMSKQLQFSVSNLDLIGHFIILRHLSSKSNRPILPGDELIMVLFKG